MSAPDAGHLEHRRRRLASTLLFTALPASALTAAMAFVSAIACLGGRCGHGPSGYRLAFFTVAAIAILGSLAGVPNFLFRLKRHGWSGLNGWQKSVADVALAALLAPLLVDAAFWMLYHPRG